MSIQLRTRHSLFWCLWSSLPLALAIDDLWKVSIDLSPAPSPEDGPPFSAHASRDRELLPYQILGIVGSYFVVVFILGTFILTIGRSLRLKAQTLVNAPIEMVKPTAQNFDSSPNPNKGAMSWLTPKRLKSQKSINSERSGVSQHRSPGIDSIASFDNSVLEADRLRRQEEMERLYAAVMQHDERQSQSPPAREDEVHNAPPPQYSQGRQLAIDTSARYTSPEEAHPTTFETPTSPVRSIYPSAKNSISSISSPVPSFSQRDYGGPKKMRKSLRSLKIGSPMAIDDNSDGARTPLSPREYTNPGIPPEPPSARTIDSSHWRTDDQYRPHVTPVDTMRDLPRPHPSRGSSSKGPELPTAQPLGPRVAVASVNNQLPFRQLAAQNRFQQSQPFQPPQSATSAAFPLSPTAPWNYPASAGPVKTTFLDVRRDKFAPGIRTGAATPYSPYMPFTPLTPVTPYLPSRRERKQHEKEQRAAHGVLTEEDEVQSEKDLWGSGY